MRQVLLGCILFGKGLSGFVDLINLAFKWLSQFFSPFGEDCGAASFISRCDHRAAQMFGE
jgi:hypothetical protein